MDEPITEGQVVRISYGLFTEMVHFQEDYWTWRAKSEPEKTWTTFQAHSIDAQSDLREHQHTSCQGGYITGTAYNTMEMSMVFANLAQAMAEDQAAVTNLTTSNNNLTEQVALYTNRLPNKEDDNMDLQKAIKKLQG